MFPVLIRAITSGGCGRLTTTTMSAIRANRTSTGWAAPNTIGVGGHLVRIEMAPLLTLPPFHTVIHENADAGQRFGLARLHLRARPINSLKSPAFPTRAFRSRRRLSTAGCVPTGTRYSSGVLLAGWGHRRLQQRHLRAGRRPMSRPSYWLPLAALIPGIRPMVADLLLIGLGITLEPFPLTAFILLLSAEKGTRKGLAFILGWLACLVAVIAAVVAGDRGQAARAEHGAVDRGHCHQAGPGRGADPLRRTAVAAYGRPLLASLRTSTNTKRAESSACWSTSKRATPGSFTLFCAFSMQAALKASMDSVLTRICT